MSSVDCKTSKDFLSLQPNQYWLVGPCSPVLERYAFSGIFYCHTMYRVTTRHCQILDNGLSTIINSFRDMIAPSSEFEVVTERNNDSILVEWWLASWSNSRPIYLSNQVGEVRNKKGKNKLKINCKSCYSFSSAVFTKN